MHHLLDKPFTLVPTCLVAFVVTVAISDTLSRRIPNTLTVSAAVIGVLANFFVAGVPGIFTSALGLVAGLALFLPFYIARGFGAGDVKAMAAVGAFLGPKGALLAAAWILVTGALCATVLLVGRGGCAAVTGLIHRWSTRAWVLFSTGTLVHIAPSACDAARRRFPYGLAIACGTIVSLAWS